MKVLDNIKHKNNLKLEEPELFKEIQENILISKTNLINVNVEIMQDMKIDKIVSNNIESNKQYIKKKNVKIIIIVFIFLILFNIKFPPINSNYI